MEDMKVVSQLRGEEPEKSSEASFPDVSEKVVLLHCNYLLQRFL
jgi:hypothetical protein